MNNTVPIINSYSDKLNIKYDICNGDHLVYIGLGNQVRGISFPTKESASSFIRSLSTYRKLKVVV